MDCTFHNLGRNNLLLQFEEEISLEVHQKVKSVFDFFQNQEIQGVLGTIPAYNSITIQFDVDLISVERLKEIIQKIAFKPFSEIEKNIVRIPVCYEAPFALDIQELINYSGLTQEQIIQKHTATPYLCYMIGFTPGFMYLGGLNKQLHCPRKETPRLQIEKGSVGIADQQTGVYPQATPAGWQIIGRTPVELFTKEKGSLVQMGDWVEFYPISLKEFKDYKIIGE